MKQVFLWAIYHSGPVLPRLFRIVDPVDSILPGNGQAIINFTPGADNGTPITGYRYIKDDGSGISTILGTTGRRPQGIAIDGAGNVYTVNYDYDYAPRGDGDVSKITPGGTSTILGTTGMVPLAIALDAAGNVYTANYGSNNVSKLTLASIVTYPATGDTSPITIMGLTNGTEYSISLIAVNSAGEGVASNVVAVTPGEPDDPTIDSIVSGNGQATITFTPGTAAQR